MKNRSQPYLDALVALYHESWPNGNALYQALEICIQLDANAVHIFRAYINDSNHSHFNRYKRIPLCLDAYLVTESNEFKHLNKMLNTLLFQAKIKNNPNSNHTTYRILVDLLKTIVEYISANPRQAILLILGIFLVSAVIAKIDEENKKCEDNDVCPYEPQQPNYLFPPLNDSFSYHPEHKNLPITDIPHFDSCRTKNEGASEGKICRLNGTTFFLKKIKNAKENNGNNPILGECNRLFIKNNIGIEKGVPDSRFFYEKKSGEYYYASKKVKSFNTAKQLCQGEINYVWCDYDRNALIRKIGENAIAQLAVVNTFVKDVHATNWGFVQDMPFFKALYSRFSYAFSSIFAPPEGHLVVIDADQSPGNLTEYINHASNKFSLPGLERGFGIPLTLNDIQRMKQIYETMLTRPVLIFNSVFDMTQDLYQTLLTLYLRACESAINCISYSQEHQPSDAPSFENNKQLASCIRLAASDYTANSESTASLLVQTGPRLNSKPSTGC